MGFYPVRKPSLNCKSEIAGCRDPLLLAPAFHLILERGTNYPKPCSAYEIDGKRRRRTIWGVHPNEGDAPKTSISTRWSRGIVLRPLPLVALQGMMSYWCHRLRMRDIEVLNKTAFQESAAPQHLDNAHQQFTAPHRRSSTRRRHKPPETREGVREADRVSCE